jgi:hypothetical protein
VNVQKQSIGLISDELARQAEWLGLAGVRLSLEHVSAPTARKLNASINTETDVIAHYQNAVVRHNVTLSAEIGRLVEEIRRYHGLRPGPPLERLDAPAGPKRKLTAESGPGEDVAYAAQERQLIAEPVAYAERRFGSTGPFLRRRKWNIDFYEGSFQDLTAYYRKLGYRDFFRLRAPYISYGREAYLLGAEQDRNLRPRLVYCSFRSKDLYVHTRAQYAVLRRATGGADPIVQTLTCEDCPSRVSQARRSIRELLDSAPFQPIAGIMGYEYLFSEVLRPALSGDYDNEEWRVRFYDTHKGVLAVIEAKQTAFGEAAGAPLAELAARGVTKLFYAGPAAGVADVIKPGRVYAPQRAIDTSGRPLPWRNSLENLPRSGIHRSLSSPLLATAEWHESARSARVESIDTEISSVIEKVLAERGGVDLGVGIITTTLSHLHPEEDRAVYTVETERQEFKEAAKLSYRDQVLRQLGLDPRNPAQGPED